MSPQAKAKDTSPRYIVTCEHASPSVPRTWAQLFESPAAQGLLKTHAGYDLGAAAVARALARRLDAPMFEGSMTRLLIDFNRSLHHPGLFSRWSRELSAKDKARLVAAHAAYRAPIERWIAISRRPVIHLSIHSFTPVMNGKARPTDVGILLDPARPREAQWGQELKRLLKRHSEWTIHQNLPYRGTADGFTSALRGSFPPQHYLGIEIELNQRRLATTPGQRRAAELLSTCLLQMPR